MKQVSKSILKKKIINILDIAPYLWQNPDDVFKALNDDWNDPIFPLKAIEEVIAELKKEKIIEQSFEWVE